MEAISELHGAKWIGVPKEELYPRNGNVLAYFRTGFVLKKLCRMQISVSGHSRFKLWINGQRVLTGPCKGDRWRHFYDVVDVGRYLVTGENIIAAEVIYYPPSRYREKNMGGPMSIVSNVYGPCFILKGQCRAEDGRLLADITTGTADWSYYLDEAVSWIVKDPQAFMPIGANEKVTGGLIPWGWKNDRQLDEGWKTAIPQWDADGSAWGEFSPLPLQKRPFPPAYETRKTFVREMDIKKEDLPPITFEPEGKVELPKGVRRVIELDAGELATGFFMLKTFGGSGSRIRITYAESYSQPAVVQYAVKGVRNDCTNYILDGYGDEYYPSGNYDMYEPFLFRTFRFIRLEVETADEQLVLFKPSYLETGYPLDIKSCISSDAPWIGSLWTVSLRTLQRCIHDTYEDCPYYEQLQYTLDTRLEALFTYMVSGDVRLAAKAIEDFHYSMVPEGILQSRAPSDEPNIIPVFSLYWILMLEDYYMQTGDAAIVKRYRPTVDAILDWFDRKTGSSGLTEKYVYWEFLDWVEEWQNEQGYVTAVPKAAAEGSVTTANLIYATALKSAAKLMKITGRSQTGDEYAARAEQLLDAVRSLCWNEKKGLYREGPGIEEYTHHAQAFAVLSGLVRGEEARSLLKRALADPDAHICTYVFRFYLFRAMEAAELYEETEALWDIWKDALPLNLTTWPEDLTRQRSDCHGWGSLPLYEFTRCILGVQPTAAGWEKIRIRPHTLSLYQAKGRVITGKGMVEVQWNRRDGVFECSGLVPDGVPFDVVMPDGSVGNFCNGGYFRLACKI